MTMCKVLVTGATGFVGRILVQELARRGISVRAGVREAATTPVPGVEAVAYDLSARPDSAALLTGVDTVFHLAARVHRLHEAGNDLDAGYRRPNCEATLDLARAAVAAGCRRLVFASSVKVNGEATQGVPFRASDEPAPMDAYARSKRDAEAGLFEIARESGLEVVVIRPPLVYGPGVGANFLRLMRLVERRVPLPLARVDNRRSLVYVANLVDALLACASDAVAAGQTYMVSDGMAVSTPGLIGHLAEALGTRPNLWSAPRWLLESSAAVLGRRDQLARLTGSLVVDDQPIRRELGWRPPFTMRDGLAVTARWFLGGTR